MKEALLYDLSPFLSRVRDTPILLLARPTCVYRRAHTRVCFLHNAYSQILLIYTLQSINWTAAVTSSETCISDTGCTHPVDQRRCYWAMSWGIPCWMTPFVFLGDAMTDYVLAYRTLTYINAVHQKECSHGVTDLLAFILWINAFCVSLIIIDENLERLYLYFVSGIAK